MLLRSWQSRVLTALLVWLLVLALHSRTRAPTVKQQQTAPTHAVALTVPPHVAPSPPPPPPPSPRPSQSSAARTAPAVRRHPPASDKLYVETAPEVGRSESQGDTIHVALASDANHFAALPGAILSAVNHTSAPLSFHVLVPPEQLASAKSALTCFGVPLASPPRLAVDVLPYRPQLAAPVRVVADAAVTGNLASPLNFARFELPRLLPSLSRLLYLDADVMVQADLGELWRTELPRDAAVGAVPRAEAHFKYKRYAAKCAALYEARRGAPLQPEKPTFNAGVLLIDLARWRQQNLTAEAEWWMAQHAAAPDGLWALGSQPPLHLALHGRWAALPPSWNLDGLGRVGNLKPAALRAAKLLHWTGKHKPWLPGGMYVVQWRRHVGTLCAESGTGGEWRQVPWFRKPG